TPRAHLFAPTMSTRPTTAEEPSREPEDEAKQRKYLTIMEHLGELR
ncbi:unnamed protein product, partial [marine sediment metagenome]